MLHTLIVARIYPLGIGSGYLRRSIEHPDDLSPSHAQRTRLFHSPFVLDNWAPRFTLLNLYRGGDRDSSVSLLARLFGAFSSLTVRSVCVMLQTDDHDRWHIYREVRRGEVSRTSS
jgi:hypothetical protein